MSVSGVHVVWFKRDLRVHDHAALTAAVESGAPVIPLYILEPGYWRLPEHSGRQFEFLMESLSDLSAALAERGAPLIVHTGEAVRVLSDLHVKYGLAAIHAHEETGLQWTFDRDIAVREWAARAGVPFREYRQHGVIRGLRNRDGWAARWEKQMRAPRLPAPAAIPATRERGEDPADANSIARKTIRLAPDPCRERQRGGRGEAVTLLRSFLAERGRTYRTDMSSPLTAFEACSRLSPHLALGTISMREAYQAARRGEAEARETGDTVRAKSLDSFIARLHWHCHFIQKLENETAIERRSLHTAYQDLRPVPADDDRLLIAWSTGRTGFPFVDACMRALNATGWLNFRMRAMLMAFSSYHLWLDWKKPAEHLARKFTDFEAGIHYPQVQMQSGTTGVNTARIYNPVKQSLDQDPDGVFIRRWVPELADLDTAALHAPWEHDVDLAARGYPERIVDHVLAARQARERIYSRRGGRGYRKEASAIQDKHGSRKSGIRNRGQVTRPAKSDTRKTAGPAPSGSGKSSPPHQLSLDLPS